MRPTLTFVVCEDDTEVRGDVRTRKSANIHCFNHGVISE